MNLKLIIALAVAGITVAGCGSTKMSKEENYYWTGHRSASEWGGESIDPDPRDPRATTYPSDPFQTQSSVAAPIFVPAPVMAPPVVVTKPAKRQGWFRRTGERVKTFYRQKKQRVRTFLGKTP